jgi:hypothetical protein
MTISWKLDPLRILSLSSSRTQMSWEEVAKLEVTNQASLNKKKSYVLVTMGKSYDLLKIIKNAILQGGKIHKLCAK